jgi:rhodanese-related sulfurtransferase
MKNLSQEEWKQGILNGNNVEILDVRTPDEYEEGHIPNAKNIDIYKGQGFLDEVNELDKSKEYYVYCRSGARSAQACALMQQQGFENTYNLQGGIMEWEGEVIS